MTLTEKIEKIIGEDINGGIKPQGIMFEAGYNQRGQNLRAKIPEIIKVVREDVLEEIDKLEKFIGNAPDVVGFLDKNVCSICGQPFNKSKQVEELKAFLNQ